MKIKIVKIIDLEKNMYIFKLNEKKNLNELKKLYLINKKSKNN